MTGAPTGTVPAEPAIAVVNGGSSSIKFALYRAGRVLERTLDGTMNLAGSDGTRLIFTDQSIHPPEQADLEVPAGTRASRFLIDWLESRPAFRSVQAVGHRVVHGMRHGEPAIVTAELLHDLRRIRPFDPDHLPLEIELIESFSQRHPALLQLACFDTAFHRGMPQVAKLLPIPRRYQQQGVHRYGFHGLSYTYLMEELARAGDPAAAVGRVILAHLGNGASMAAVHRGHSVDTSMGFTPSSGLMMSTRSGDLDPGLVNFLTCNGTMTTTQFDHMTNHESGLLGVSGISPDVRELLALEAQEPQAAEALALFCYQAKKYLGAYAAALGGLDTLVFAGGIGENQPLIRERICAGLEFLGIHIDRKQNASNAALISPEGARVSVRVIRTDEQLIIARLCAAMLARRRKKDRTS
jgi:acetate kinase